MDLICRICQQSEVEELIHISCTVATQQKRVGDMFSVVVGSSVEEYDRLPKHLCNKCFGRLDRAYCLWKLCRSAVRKERPLHCRICCALIGRGGFFKGSKKWDMAIGEMVQHLSGVFIESNDSRKSWFVCQSCLNELDAALEFKRKCIESEARLLKNRSFLWERMEVDASNLRHLVMDVFTKAVQNHDDLTKVHCSVCFLEVKKQQLGKKCEGCMLEFQNYDELRSAQVTLCAEENNGTNPVEEDGVWLEEILSQEIIDLAPGQEYLIENDVPFEPDTDADNNNQPEISEANKYFVHVGKNKTEYEIIEKYPEDPFPKARRTGPFCCKCMAFFDTKNELQAHTNQRHQKPADSGEFSCDVCLSPFVDQQSLELHKSMSRTFSYDFCKSCQIVLSSPAVLMEHKKSFHKEFETVENEQPTVNNNDHTYCPPTQRTLNYHTIDKRDATATKESSLTEVETNVCVSGDTNSTGATKENQHSSQEPHVKSTEHINRRSIEEEVIHKDLKEIENESATNKDVFADKEITREDQRGFPMEVETSFKTEIHVTYDCCLRNCRKRYSSEEQLLKHMNTAHDHSEQPLGMVCQYCKVEFPTESALLEHSNRRVQRTIYRCSTDGCCFSRMVKSSIIEHCSRKPHIRYASEYNNKPAAIITSQPLDLKHFSVVSKMDDNTDIVERKSELCCSCFLVFKSKEELTIHCKQHGNTEGGQPFHCQVCGRGFSERSAYTSHRNLIENPVHYFCRVCEEILWAKIDYTSHRATVHFPDEINAQMETTIDAFFTCCACKEPLETEAELVEHRREKHQPPSTSSSSKSTLKCDHCHMVFSKAEELEKHIDPYESRITYKCKFPSCDFSSKDTERMSRHIHGSTRHKGALRTAEPAKFFCCILDCEFRCPHYDTLIEHGTSMHADRHKYYSRLHENRRLKCPVCGKGFDCERILKLHKYGRRLFYCKGCELKVPREEKSSHVRCVDKLSVKCKLCGALLATEKGLQKHMKTVHNEKKGRVCSICGKKVASLPAHMASHENERNWECKHCPARFNSIYMLRCHTSRIHLNERKYPCRQGCEKSYKGPGDRDRHEKLVHLGITPFRCDFCEASFVRLRDLKLHQRKHTGLKLYPCPQCNAGFDKKSEYDDHARQCKGSVLQI